MRDLYDRLAAEIPEIGRGRVWCRKCGSTRKVNGAECLRFGWPKCCGQTMTIDEQDGGE